jgi:hypothetical protein
MRRQSGDDMVTKLKIPRRKERRQEERRNAESRDGRVLPKHTTKTITGRKGICGGAIMVCYLWLLGLKAGPYGF